MTHTPYCFAPPNNLARHWHRLTLYCYDPQRNAVAALMSGISMPLDTVRPVRDAYPLRGCTLGTFVEIVGHPETLPRDIQEALAAYGWTVWRLDDSYARACAEQRHAR